MLKIPTDLFTKLIKNVLFFLDRYLKITQEILITFFIIFMCLFNSFWPFKSLSKKELNIESPKFLFY